MTGNFDSFFFFFFGLYSVQKDGEFLGGILNPGL